MRVRWLLVPLISSYWMRDLIQKCIVVTLRRKSGPSVVRSSSPSPPFPAFIGVTNRVVGDNPIVPVLLRRPTPLWVAVPADPSRVAVRLVSVFPAQSLVVEARVFSNCIPHCPVVGSVAVPSVAPVVYQVAARVAGQNGLCEDYHLRPSGVPADFDAVGDRGSGGLGPEDPQYLGMCWFLTGVR